MSNRISVRFSVFFVFFSGEVYICYCINLLRKMERKNYETPEAEAFCVSQERNFLNSGDGYGTEKSAGQDFGTRTYRDDF